MKRWSLPVATLMLGLVLGTYSVATHLHGQSPPPPLPPPVPPPPVQVEKNTIPREAKSYRDIVKRLLPAVVSIDTKGKAVANQFKPQLPEGVPPEFRKYFEELQKQQESLEQRVGFGSGFFVDPSGVVLTNYHVINGADQVVVHLADGRKFTSRDLRGDRRTDLAIIKLDLKGATVPYLSLGDSNAMEIGDHVLAVGAPFGLTGSVTHGIVSAKGRAGLNMNMYEDFLQTDAAINPGNSGGPLVNLSGEVVGINAAIKSQSGGFQGISLAIASNLAKQVVKALLTDGVVRRGYIGVQIRPLDEEQAAKMGIAKDAGVVVAEVYDSTPAAKAGLKAGDVIMQIGKTTIKDGRTLQNTIAYMPIGKAADLTIHRDGKVQSLAVTIEEQPTQFGTLTSPLQQR
jgi:serine protease Do